MTRQLSTVDIAGTLFYVDALHEELRQMYNSKNRIPFEVFEQDADGYTFLYDTKRKNVPEEEVTELGTRYRWVTLPALMELDPEGIALKYDIPLEILLPETKNHEMSKQGIIDEWHQL